MKNELILKNAPLMVWSITDHVIEDPATRLMQFRDLKDAGFGGVAAFVRCSRYSWDDGPARAALRHISGLCRREGLQFWVGPDPRWVSHKLVGDSSGLELLLFGNTTRADVWPNVSPVQAGRFTVRCQLTPRHVHTLTDVAIDFRPLGLMRVYAIRDRGRALGKKDVLNITRQSHMFYNARDRYVEAFGQVDLDDEAEWKILAFFHVRTSHVDVTNDAQFRRYESMLARLSKSGCNADGIMWDEPGFTCTYGSLPFSTRIRKGYSSVAGRQLEADLWKLAYDAEDRSHIRIRMAYFTTVQGAITRAEKKLKSISRRLWGPETVLGIHDTWHFDSAEMCDMNHGSMDLWQTVQAKSGGFVDLGALQQLRDPASPYYQNFAAIMVIASSLGKLSEGGFAYHNIWTMDDESGAGSQHEPMDHCVKVLALFGIRWLAHLYGPAGTIGQERTFLGSPSLPGYPDHVTWKDFPQWNRFLRREMAAAGGHLPSSRLLVLFPVETMYALADSRADAAARKIFDLLLSLLDNHYHVDVLSTTCIADGAWRGKQFNVCGLAYDCIVYPWPTVVNPELMRALVSKGNRVLYAFDRPRSTTSGRAVKAGGDDFAGTSAEVLGQLARHAILRPVKAPERTWVTLIPHPDGTVVSIMPSRASGRYSGILEYEGNQVHIEETPDLIRVLFPESGNPRVL